MTEEPTSVTVASPIINEESDSSEVPQEAPMSPTIETPQEASPPTPKPRTKKQIQSLGNARTTLAKKRQQQSDLARADELAHLESVNTLLNENILLRSRLREIPEIPANTPPKPKPRPAPSQPAQPPPEPESPPSIQKPRVPRGTSSSYGGDRMMSARDLFRSMGM